MPVDCRGMSVSAASEPVDCVIGSVEQLDGPRDLTSGPGACAGGSSYRANAARDCTGSAGDCTRRMNRPPMAPGSSPRRPRYSPARLGDTRGCPDFARCADAYAFRDGRRESA